MVLVYSILFVYAIIFSYSSAVKFYSSTTNDPIIIFAPIFYIGWGLIFFFNDLFILNFSLEHKYHCED